MASQIDCSIGGRLQLKREQDGLTVEQVAQALNIKADFIRAYEAGTRRIPADVLINLCSFFNVSPGYFLRAFVLPHSKTPPTEGNVIPLRRHKR